jgi:hypothetical protein
MATPKNPSWHHLNLVLWLIGIYVGIKPLLWLVAVVGGGLADIGHAGGEARGISFMMSTLRATPYIYLTISFLLLILIKFRNTPCLLINGLAFALSAYFSVQQHQIGYSLE